MTNQKQRILVVDSEKKLESTIKTLRDNGYIVEVPEPEKSIEIFRRNGFGAVVTTLREIPQKVKEIRPKTPVIFFSPSASIDTDTYRLSERGLINDILYPELSEPDILESFRKNLLKINVGIVGIGKVGNITAHELIKENFVEHLYLLGPKTESNLEKTKPLNDIERIIEELSRIDGVDPDSLHSCKSIEDIIKSDVIVVCLKSPKYDYRNLPVDENIRRIGLKYDTGSMINLAKGLKENNYQGTLWLISNPISEFCNVFLNQGFDPSKIFGSSNDSDRLRTLIRDSLNEGRDIYRIGEEDILRYYVIGDHRGRAMIPIFSSILIKDPKLRDEHQAVREVPIKKTKLKNRLGEITHALNMAGIKTIYNYDGSVAPIETASHIGKTLKHILFEPEYPVVVIGYYPVEKNDPEKDGAFVALPAIFDDKLRIQRIYMPQSVSQKERERFRKVYEENLRFSNFYRDHAKEINANPDNFVKLLSKENLI